MRTSNKSNELGRGAEIAGYKVIRLLFHRGATSVYRAKDTDDAVRLLEVVDLSKANVSLFEPDGEFRSATILRELDNDGLPELLHSFDSSIGQRQVLVLVFRDFSVEPIFELIRREALVPTYRALPLIVDLLSVLTYLHDPPRQIVHGAVSPDTVVLDYTRGESRVKLMGLEHARKIGSPRRRGALRNISLFHSAPESLLGNPTPQSDIFSAAALLYHLILGTPPWFDEEIASMRADMALESLEGARERPPSFCFVEEDVLDPHLKNTLEKALAIDPDDRFQSADEFRLALLREVRVEPRTHSLSSTLRQEKKHGSGFDAIAGMEELKSVLQEEVIRPITEADRFAEFGIPMINGVLLYGPPGCGKTFVAERLVEEVGFSFIKVTPSDLASPFVHGGQEKIGALFKEAHEKAPCVVFIDEIDAVIPSRDSKDISHHYAAEVNEVLAQTNNCGKRGVFVIGASNRPEKIDSAMLRSGRFDRLIYIPPPDLRAREAIFRLLLRTRPVEILIDFELIAKNTQGYISSDIEKLVVSAARLAERKEKRIGMDELLAAIDANGPSVSSDELDEFDELHRRWIAARSGESPRPSIGFVASKKNRPRRGD